MDRAPWNGIAFVAGILLLNLSGKRSGTKFNAKPLLHFRKAIFFWYISYVLVSARHVRNISNEVEQ